MNEKFTILQKSGYEFVVFEDIMNQLKTKTLLTFNSEDYYDFALFNKLFRHVQWLHKYGCLTLGKPLYADNVLVSFSCSNPDFVQYETLKKSDFDIKHVLVGSVAEAVQLAVGIAKNFFTVK